MLDENRDEDARSSPQDTRETENGKRKRKRESERLGGREGKSEREEREFSLKNICV